MHWWQKTLFWLSRITLRLTVFFAITIAVFLALIGTPQTIQDYVKNSGAYETMVNRILDETSKLDDSENSVPVNDPEIRKLANETFPPQRLEEMFIKVSNGTYRWLNGEVPKPDYVLDLSAEKRAIAKGVSKYAKQRVEALPTCTKLPTTTDPFELDCRPPGTDLNKEAKKIEADMLASDGFLPDTTITFDDEGKVNQADLDRISNGFQTLQRLPIMLTVIALCSAAGVIFLAPTRRGGFTRIARSLLSTGLFLAIATLVFGKLLPALSPSLKAQFKDGSFAGIMNNIALQAVDRVVEKTLLYCGIIIIISILIFIGLRLTNHKPKIVKPPKSNL